MKHVTIRITHFKITTFHETCCHAKIVQITISDETEALQPCTFAPASKQILLLGDFSVGKNAINLGGHPNKWIELSRFWGVLLGYGKLSNSLSIFVLSSRQTSPNLGEVGQGTSARWASLALALGSEWAQLRAPTALPGYPAAGWKTCACCKAVLENKCNRNSQGSETSSFRRVPWGMPVMLSRHHHLKRSKKWCA